MSARDANGDGRGPAAPGAPAPAPPSYDGHHAKPEATRDAQAKAPGGEAALAGQAKAPGAEAALAGQATVPGAEAAHVGQAKAPEVALDGDAAALLAQAGAATAAADLSVGLPARAAPLAEALVAIFERAPLAAAPARALWNLLWLAAEIAPALDLYRAARLWRAVERLFTRFFAPALVERGELSDAAEMAFDFFFAGRLQPLEAVRRDELVATLGRILALDNRFCQRAALHGLSHLKERHADAGIDAVITGFLARGPDAALADYAREALAGALP